MILTEDQNILYSNTVCMQNVIEKEIHFNDSVNSNSLAFDTESSYHKNIFIVCIRHIPGKSFLFSNYVICNLDVETPYATHPLQLFALADLDYERQLW